MGMFRYLSILLLSLTLGCASASADPTPSARAMVMDTTERLMVALQDQHEAIKQDIDTAYRIADATVMPMIDFPRIARWVVGKYWRQANETQRTQITDEFQELLTRSYVTAMVTYSDKILANANNISYPENRSRQDDRNALVTMLIRLENGKEAQVQYQMHRADDTWKIFDVKVEGVSLAITYRSTFAQEIDRGGIDGLIAQLEQRNAKAETISLQENQ